MTRRPGEPRGRDAHDAGRGRPVVALLVSSWFLVSGAMMPPALAQVPTENPFGHSPIRYHLDITNLTFASWYYRIEARQAFAYWAEGGAGELPWLPRFAPTDDPSQADIRVWFRDASRVGETCDNSTEALGCARGAPPWSWDVEIRMRDDVGRLYSYQTIGDVATHEVGHTLGLGHSTDPRSIMYFAVDTTRYAGARPIEDPWPVLGGVALLLAMILGGAWALVRVARRPEAEEDEDAPEGDLSGASPPRR